MCKALITCFLSLFSLALFAQNITLSGTVLDENKQPIAYSNVVVATDDSSVTEGTITNEAGVFSFENLKANNYTLTVSFLGFEAQTLAIDLNKTTQLAAIILKEKLETLNDVTLTVKRPTVKRMVDRLVFNVENSSLSNTNVLDVLKQTPGVLVHDGTITVKHSVPTVYINDKKVQLSMDEVQQLLEGTSATTIKSIEVITNPPAKYEAEGGSVLNIITSKTIVAGYNGNMFSNYSMGEIYPKYTFGTSHFFKTKKLNTYLNYSVNPKKEFRHNSESIFFTENGQNTTSWETDYKRTRNTSNHNINTSIDYEFNAANSLGVSANMLVAPRDHTKTFVNSLTEVFDAAHVLDSTFHTKNRMADETFNFALTLDYVHKFKKEGEKLMLSAHHTNYDFLSFQDVKTGYFYPNTTTAFRDNNFQTFSKQVIKLYTGQIDYELPLSETAQFEAGSKVSNISSKSILRQYLVENGVKIEDLQNTDTFLYDETNSALYTSYAKDWERWSLKLGVRAEYTDIVGTSKATNTQSNKNYVEFFPSFYLLHNVDDHNAVYFNYNRRIYRPRYSELNPFKYFLNDNAYIAGDPNLKPQIDDVLTLGYTINKNYTFELYYRFENNPTLEMTFQDNEENLIKYINTNIDKSISYGLDFTTYTQLANRWNLYVLASLFYYENHFVALESANTLYTNDRWSVYSQIINYFSLLKDKSLTADVAYLYISSLVDGANKISNRQGLDITFRKTLWKGRASVNMGVRDVFNSQNFSTKTQYLNQDLFFKSRMENRLLVAGFTYKFGNYHLKPKQKELELEERDRLENKHS